jgi:hypothetical protein
MKPGTTRITNHSRLSSKHYMRNNKILVLALANLHFKKLLDKSHSLKVKISNGAWDMRHGLPMRIPKIESEFL